MSASGRPRNSFRLLVASGVEEKGRLVEILGFARGRSSISEVLRGQLDHLGENHQGVALEVSAYPYAEIADILDLAESRRNRCSS